MRPLAGLALLFSALCAVLPARAAEEPVLNLYSHRHYESDDQLFEAFKKQTGITVNVTQATADQLISRLRGEGRDTEADLLVTVDAGRLANARSLDLLQPVDSPVLKEKIPAHLRDPENFWFGFTVRARVIVYAKDRVKPGEIKTYEDLADPKWRGRVLIRSGESVYNQSLVASLIANDGKAKAAAWVEAVGANLARKPLGGDREQVSAIARKLGDVAVVNSYYLGQMSVSKDPAEREAYSKVSIVFPNQENRGAHINVSGAGITKYAKHPENARKFLEFLAGDEAQKVFPAETFEYPVNLSLDTSELHKTWGAFKADPLNLGELGKNHKAAVLLLEEGGW
ncbi:MAG: Fe(3+) ABC transporter substrate-binding protein [Verrucomicrobiaceae bacterium]|nr:MAG: Fe(3+) ABC transporter substrate-binding protein [Verrucomicrobiaceae bacterium]